MSEILPGIYLGSKKDALNIEWLRETGITSILNVAKSTFNINYSDHPDLNIEIMKIPLEDKPTEDIGSELDIGYTFINLCKIMDRKILIHCYAGISRSSTFLLYYIMKKHKVSLEKALEISRKKRPIIRPNPGFLQTLYERQINHNEYY